MAPSRVRIPPSPLAQRPPRFCAHPRRGGRAVECGGLENRYPSLGGSRVQIPPPPHLPSRDLGAKESISRRSEWFPKPRVRVQFLPGACAVPEVWSGVTRASRPFEKAER